MEGVSKNSSYCLFLTIASNYWALPVFTPQLLPNCSPIAPQLIPGQIMLQFNVQFLILLNGWKCRPVFLYLEWWIYTVKLMPCLRGWKIEHSFKDRLSWSPSLFSEWTLFLYLWPWYHIYWLTNSRDTHWWTKLERDHLQQIAIAWKWWSHILELDLTSKWFWSLWCHWSIYILWWKGGCSGSQNRSWVHVGWKWFWCCYWNGKICTVNAQKYP